MILQTRINIDQVLEKDGDPPRRTPIEQVFHLTA
jgi:hypothetical protein